MVDRSREHDQQGDASRRQILVRASVVVGLVVCLIAGLWVYEQQQKSLASLPEPKPLGRPVSPIGNVTASSPVLSEEINKAIREAPDVTQTALASMSGPVATPEAATFDPTVPREDEPPKEVAKQSQNVAAPRGEALVPAAPGKGLAQPAVSAPPARPKTTPAVAPAVAARPADKVGERVLAEETKAVVSPPPPAAAKAASVSTPPALRPSQAPVTPAVPNPAGFVVQLGVFNNHDNAEELRSRLALAGIPTMVEIRVQLGPFKNRDEALKAQQTLRKLGLAPGLLVPPRKP